MLERKYLRELDWYLVAVYLLLVAWGLIAVASATGVDFSNPATMGNFNRQAGWALASIGVLVLTVMVDYRHLERFDRVWYALIIGLLVLVIVDGVERGGAQRWLAYGPISFQPAEFAKVLIILVLATVMARQEGYWTHWADMLFPVAYVLPPMALVALQPDLGTSLVFPAVLLGMLLVSGVRLRWLAGLTAAGVAAVAAGFVAQFRYGYPLLTEYQVGRLVAFTNPEAYRLDHGYQIIQSLQTIGSGQLVGQGLFQGRSTQLQFLPEQHTDFIFTVIGEEMGFLGGALLIMVFGILLYRGLLAAMDAQDLYGTLLATGVVTMFAFHIVVNVGMALGIMPVTGLPLPFLSYGGTHLMASSIGVGLLLNVGMHRRKILF